MTQDSISPKRATNIRFQIGDLEFDLTNQTLLISGEKRQLTPKASRLLEQLTASAPNPLTREQLMDLVWPEVLVSDHTLHELVSQLRKQLGDDVRTPRYIKTLSKRGYQLVAPIKQISGARPLGSATSPELSLSVVLMDGQSNQPGKDAREILDELLEHFVHYPELILILENPAQAAYTLSAQLAYSDTKADLRVHLVRTIDQQLIWADSFYRSNNGKENWREIALQTSRRARLQMVCDVQCQSIRARAGSHTSSELTCAAVRMNYQINQAGSFDPELMRSLAERSVQLDPTLIEGWQMLTIAYVWLFKFGRISAHEAVEKSQAAVGSALGLDSENSYSLWLLGTVHATLGLDLDVAKQSLIQAIALDPLHPNAHWFHGMLAAVYRQQGALDSAVEELQRAARIFDADGRTQAEYAEVLLYTGRYAEAVSTAKSALKLKPFPPSVFFATLAGFRALMEQGQKEAASRWLNIYLATAEHDYQHHAAYMLAILGRTAEAQRLVVALQDSRSNLQGYTLVLAYMGLGDIQAAVLAAQQYQGAEGNFLQVRLRIDPALREVWKSIEHS